MVKLLPSLVPLLGSQPTNFEKIIYTLASKQELETEGLKNLVTGEGGTPYRMEKQHLTLKLLVEEIHTVE